MELAGGTAKPLSSERGSGSRLRLPCPSNQQSHGLLKVLRQGLHELRRLCPVADAVIHRDGGFRTPAGLDLALFHHRYFPGRAHRTQLDEIGHEIMRHIAELIPPEMRGYYSDDPAIWEAARGAELYPWAYKVEGQVVGKFISR